MNKLIPFDSKFEFVFLEEKDLSIQHPLADFYFKLNDLSINAIISLKWALWGFYFFNSISTELTKPEYSIEPILTEQVLKNWDFSKKIKPTLLFDDVIINTELELITLVENNYNFTIFDENTKIHFKLKLNLSEYLLLTNIYFPTLVRFE